MDWWADLSLELSRSRKCIRERYMSPTRRIDVWMMREYDIVREHCIGQILSGIDVCGS